MSKILLFSDIHIHMHKASLQRLDDCLKVLEWVFKTAIDHKIDKIVFAGDLFQDRQKIHIISYERTFNLIYKLMNAYPNLSLYLLVGNHDMWFNDRWDTSSISPLQAIPNVYVINKVATIEVLPGFNVDFLPYTKNPIEDISSRFDYKSPVLVSHLAVDGAQLHGHSISEVSAEHEGDMVKVDSKLFSGWKKVFLGHYHSAQKLNDVVEYIGSPLELNFGEAFQEKHIIIFDTETLDCEYVINDFSPKHLIIRESQVNRYKLEGNFVQILVDDIASTSIIDMRKDITKSVKTASLEFKEQKKKKPDGENQSIQEKFDFLGGEILERYVKTVGNGNLNYEKLLNIGKEIVVELK